MTLKNLLKENESTIKEYELFFNDSFQKKNIELNLYKKTNHPKNPEIAEIHITSKRFPLDLHLKETINAFLKSGVLHPRDNPNHNLLFDQLFRSKTIEKLLER